MAETQVKAKAKPKKRKKVNKTKRNYWIDLIMTGIAGIAFMPDLTGYTIHQWVGVVLGVTIMTHLALHWQWVVQITKRFFSPKLPTKQRINYIVNFGLFASFMLTLFTGLPMADWFGGSEITEDIHEAGSSLFMALVGGHLALHWKWILTNTKKYLLGQNKRKSGSGRGRKTAVSPT